MFDLLRGLKIVDLTTIVLGPYATQILGDLGADVIKVESPKGDVFRAVRPGRRDDLGASFISFNRNKRSIAIDLKREEGQRILHDLVRSADALVHNMRPSSAKKLGASYETLSAINPALVYCYSPGFGGRGKDRETPAYDDTIQARSGFASLNADRDGAPQFVGTILCDKVVGLHLAVALLSGMVRRERTGRGACIEAPMLESMASFLLAEHLAGHTLVPPEGKVGYERVMSANRKPYRTQDGYLAILPYSTKHWVRLFQASDRPELASDPRVTDPVTRSVHVDELYGLLAELAQTKTTDELCKMLSEQDIPHSRVNSLEDLLQDEHLQAAELLHKVDDPRVGALQLIRSPLEVDGELSQHKQPDMTAPILGEHTDAILRELDYSEEKIEELRSNEVIVSK